MAINPPYISSTQVASSVPFDNSTNGFTATDVQAAIEEILTYSPQNVVYVDKNGNDTTGTGKFERPYLTLVKAMSTITTASTTNRYVINIGVGVFSENNPIALKPNVFLFGASGSLRATKIVAANANQHLFTCTDTVLVEYIYMSGVTGSGFALVNCTGSTSSNGYIRFSNCQFGASDTLFSVSSSTSDTDVILNNCICGHGDQFNNGFVVDGGSNVGGVIPAEFIIQNMIVDDLVSTYPNYIVYAKNYGVISIFGGDFDAGATVSTGVGLKCDSGGEIEMVGAKVCCFATGATTLNSGAAPTLNISGIYFEDCTADLNIAHTGTLGGLAGGVSARAKITNSAPTTFTISFFEQGYGEVLDAITDLSALVTEPISTATTASGTLTLNKFSNMFQILTGSAASFTVKLPDATTLSKGMTFLIANTTNLTVAVNDGSGALLFTLAQTALAYCYLQSNSTAAGVWIFWQVTTATASGLVTYSITSSTPFASSASVDTLITGMTITPQAGTYGIWYSASVTASGSGSSLTSSIYAGASVVADSVRFDASPSGAHIFTTSTQTIHQFDGATACTIKINPGGASMTVGNRSIMLIRFGN